jgi:hypothetical protein
MWGAAVVAVLLLLFVTFAMFQGTSVLVTPRMHSVTLTEDVLLAAYPMSDERVALGALGYEMTERVIDAERSITANGFTEVEENASGLIMVYNENSANSMRLIKNTRFETPAGLIFRIRDSVVVPGKKENSPGTISVTVYADQPGEKYNVAPTDRFTLPGLKGADSYSKVYARSTVAFTGGFIGTKPKIALPDLNDARTGLRTDLEQKAREEMAKVSVPGKIAFPQLMTFAFESLPFDVDAGGKALVRERVTAKLPLFPESAFAKVLAVAARADSSDTPAHLQKTEGLSVRTITTDASAPAANGSIEILVSGSTTLVWDVNTETLKVTLAGTPKTNFQTLIGGVSSIEKADAFIRPFWRSSFPEKAEDIEVIVNEAGKQ